MNKNTRMRTCMFLSLVALPFLVGCNTLFDAPSETEASAGLSEKELRDLQALTQTQTLEALGAVASHEEIRNMKEEGSLAADSIKNSLAASIRPSKVTLLSGDQVKEPIFYFEKIASPIPQLVILSAQGSSIWWSGKQIHMPQGNASHVFLTQPGRHELVIEYSGSQVFKAEVLVARHERITLRVDAERQLPSKTSAER